MGNRLFPLSSIPSRRGLLTDRRGSALILAIIVTVVTALLLLEISRELVFANKIRKALRDRAALVGASQSALSAWLQLLRLRAFVDPTNLTRLPEAPVLSDWIAEPYNLGRLVMTEGEHQQFNQELGLAPDNTSVLLPSVNIPPIAVGPLPMTNVLKEVMHTIPGVDNMSVSFTAERLDDNNIHFPAADNAVFVRATASITLNGMLVNATLQRSESVVAFVANELINTAMMAYRADTHTTYGERATLPPVSGNAVFSSGNSQADVGIGVHVFGPARFEELVLPAPGRFSGIQLHGPVTVYGTISQAAPSGTLTEWTPSSAGGAGGKMWSELSSLGLKSVRQEAGDQGMRYLYQQTAGANIDPTLSIFCQQYAASFSDLDQTRPGALSCVNYGSTTGVGTKNISTTYRCAWDEPSYDAFMEQATDNREILCLDNPAPSQACPFQRVSSATLTASSALPVAEINLTLAPISGPEPTTQVRLHLARQDQATLVLAGLLIQRRDDLNDQIDDTNSAICDLKDDIGSPCESACAGGGGKGGKGKGGGGPGGYCQAVTDAEALVTQRQQEKDTAQAAYDADPTPENQAVLDAAIAALASAQTALTTAQTELTTAQTSLSALQSTLAALQADLADVEAQIASPPTITVRTNPWIVATSIQPQQITWGIQTTNFTNSNLRITATLLGGEKGSDGTFASLRPVGEPIGANLVTFLFNNNGTALSIPNLSAFDDTTAYNPVGTYPTETYDLVARVAACTQTPSALSILGNAPDQARWAWGSTHRAPEAGFSGTTITFNASNASAAGPESATNPFPFYGLLNTAYIERTATFVEAFIIADRIQFETRTPGVDPPLRMVGFFSARDWDIPEQTRRTGIYIYPLTSPEGTQIAMATGRLGMGAYNCTTDDNSTGANPVWQLFPSITQYSRKLACSASALMGNQLVRWTAANPNTLLAPDNITTKNRATVRSMGLTQISAQSFTIR